MVFVSAHGPVRLTVYNRSEKTPRFNLGFLLLDDSARLSIAQDVTAQVECTGRAITAPGRGRPCRSHGAVDYLSVESAHYCDYDGSAQLNFLLGVNKIGHPLQCILGRAGQGNSILIHLEMVYGDRHVMSTHSKKSTDPNDCVGY